MDIPMMNEINENTNAAVVVTTEAIEAAKTAILAAMPVGTVKSVQHGCCSPSYGEDSGSVSIATVDVSKSFLMISLLSTDYAVKSVSLTSTAVVWTGSYNTTKNPFYWVVVEYY